MSFGNFGSLWFLVVQNFFKLYFKNFFKTGQNVANTSKIVFKIDQFSIKNVQTFQKFFKTFEMKKQSKNFQKLC